MYQMKMGESSFNLSYLLELNFFCRTLCIDWIFEEEALTLYICQSLSFCIQWLLNIALEISFTQSLLFLFLNLKKKIIMTCFHVCSCRYVRLGLGSSYLTIFISLYFGLHCLSSVSYFHFFFPSCFEGIHVLNNHYINP